MAKQSHTPSRRAMLAGLAAAPVAGIPAIAGVGSDADPIFAAFAEFERAKAAKEVISTAADELRGDICATIRAAGLDPRITVSRRWLERGRELNFYSDEDYAAGLANLEACPSEIQKILLRRDEAEDADRERAICETAPTTRAGALRLLRHLADFLDEDHVVNDLYLGDVVGDAIRNAVAVLEREAQS